jgi:putative ABC transport system permease protein
VLYAGNRVILLLLSKGYMQLILIAFVIAIPVANYFITEWLGTFAYKTEVAWWLYAIPGIIILLVALLSISRQTFKAAVRNPVESLKYE